MMQIQARPLLRTSLLLTLLATAGNLFAKESCEIKYSRMHDTCMDKSGGVTADMLNCIADEMSRQDKRLNASYQSLMKVFSPQRQAALREAQRAWVKFRDVECRSRMDPEGGSIEGVVLNACVLELTTQRANDLETLRPMQ